MKENRRPRIVALLLPDVADFAWDTASLFIAGGGSTKIEATLNLPPMSADICDGIVFSLNERVVLMYTSS